MAPTTPNVVAMDLNTVTTSKKKNQITITADISALSPKATKATKDVVIAIPKDFVFPTPSTPVRHLFKTPITVSVGPKAQPFPVHLEALLACSPFFTAAFNPHYAFRESLTSTVHLKEINVADFEYFVQWLYRRSLEHESLEGPHPAYFRLIKLWKVADMLQVTACKNDIVDKLSTIADATNSVPTPDDTHALFADEVGGVASKVGALVVDLFAWKRTGNLIMTHSDSWHESFMRNLVVKLKGKNEGKDGPWVEAKTRCKKYHVHDHWAPVEMCVGKGKVAGGEDGWVKVEGEGDQGNQS